jgi:hypothetical protein
VTRTDLHGFLTDSHGLARTYTICTDLRGLLYVIYSEYSVFPTVTGLRDLPGPTLRPLCNSDLPCGTPARGELEDWGHRPCHFTARQRAEAIHAAEPFLPLFSR